VVELVGLELGTPTVAPGGTLPLTVAWRALAEMDTSYTVFVQALDEAEVKAAQMDGRPCNGGCPTSGWRPGDIVAERYVLHIRPDAPTGRYWLIAGLYDLSTGTTLTWGDGSGQDLGSHIVLGSIVVQP
jgi:hypothetical protein